MLGAFTHPKPPSSSGSVADAIAIFASICVTQLQVPHGGSKFKVLRREGNAGGVPGRDGGNEAGGMVVVEEEGHAGRASGPSAEAPRKSPKHHIFAFRRFQTT